MKERSVIFTGDEVLATLEGRKTQFRRVVKPQHIPAATRTLRWENQDAEELGLVATCPFGIPGDRMWVKETWAPIPSLKPSGYFTDPNWIHRTAWYRADNDKPTWGGPWKPSIHMPRWASRIDLEIVSVRVERVQDISEADAEAEGLDWDRVDAGSLCVDGMPGHKVWFMDRWNRTCGDNAWSRNDWVWVVEYSMLKGGKQ